MQDQLAQLQAQVQALQGENYALRQELERLRREAEAAAATRKAVLLGGGRLLIPLLDRQRVVRSFAQLASTASEFAAPMNQWPSQERVLGDTREFLESCVRFAIRRRAIITLFSLLATAIPIIQIILVFQQNEIIENQTRFAEMQVYEVVSRSMVDGNRNARLMTSALLSRSDFRFLAGVVDEAFDRGVGGIYGREGLDASTRRLEDAAFRGHLARAVNHGVATRVDAEGADEVHPLTDPMFRRIVADAADRVPVVLRLGESNDPPIPGELREEVEHYLVQIGESLRTHARLGRAVGEEASAVSAAAPFLARCATIDGTKSVFVDAFRAALDDFVVDVGLESELGAAPVDWSSADKTIEDAREQGLGRLQTLLPEASVDWDALGAMLRAG